MTCVIDLPSYSLDECSWLSSEHDAYAENDYRIALLRELADEVYLNRGRRYSTGDLYELADKLEACNEEIIECKSLACKKCNRKFKIERVNDIVSAMKLEQEHGLEFEYGIYTILQYSRSVSAYAFIDYDVPKDKDRIRKILSRCGVIGPVVGSFELDFHEKPQRWLTHYHLLMRQTGNEDAISELKSRVQKLHPINIKKNRCARPFMEQKLSDAHEQLSYIHKLASFEVRDYKTHFGKKGTHKHRLNKLMFCESLCWLDGLDRRTLPFQWHARAWLKQSKV
ncbi:hypothetical protein [Vibrio crassostreae]|uniref:hypothetical protein n=1 Tax=Vibrio crassostreae TaxID=246167 RepID=UPI001B311C69|nr:hypothetical protein [Vibrio crassostreae]